MSRIGKKPINVPSGVDLKVNGSSVAIKGPKGQLQRNLHPNMKIEFQNNVVTVTRPSDGRLDRSLHGLTRTLISNMVVGVTEGFSKTLNIVGVGYKVDLKGKALNLNLGYSHSIDYPPPEGIEFNVDNKKNEIIDRNRINQILKKVESKSKKMKANPKLIKSNINSLYI